MKVKISNIKINPGRRETEPKTIEELARSIVAVGLMNPITLDQNNTLIAGLHRLEAAKLMGWTEIECQSSAGSRRPPQHFRCPSEQTRCCLP